MAKVESKRFRGGGRNRAFFPGLAGLARALDTVIDAAPSSAGGNSGDPDRGTAAELKRKRKAIIRLRDAGLITRAEAQDRLQKLADNEGQKK